MKTKNVLIPVAGVIASVLLDDYVAPEHQVQLAVIAGLIAIALGVWVAKCESKKPKYQPIFFSEEEGPFWWLPYAQEPLKPKDAKQNPDQP